jgi:hypothetical protein
MPNPENLKAPWKKGQSGNPKGGKKKPPAMKKMVEILPDLPEVFARVLSEKKGDMTMIEAGIRRTALSWINSGNMNAGRIILEYAYGKPRELDHMKDAEQYQPPNITVNISQEAIDKLKK